MLSPNIENFLGCEADLTEARIVLFGAPFDSTTSYRPGTRFASKVMRAESYGLETYSPYQDLDMEDAKVFDSGDLELSFGNTEQALADIEARAAEILAANKLPFLIGGEHLVSLGAIRAVHNKYPDLHILHFLLPQNVDAVQWIHLYFQSSISSVLEILSFLQLLQNPINGNNMMIYRYHDQQ